MLDSSIWRWRIWLVTGAVLCAAGTWLFANRVLVSHQTGDAMFHGRPRGNFSDLYSRWVGARELLLRGRDPYSLEVTREIQDGYYGRPLAPDRSGKQNYQQAFYYPVYVVFVLAPTVDLPFEKVQKGFFWILVGLTVLSVPMWLRLLRWRLPPYDQAVIVVLTLGSLPVMQGLKLQQMTLLVVPLIAAAMVLLALDRQFAAGLLLALATIKPQLVWLVLLWLTIWTLADWRRRYRWAVSFLLAMVILCAASELYLSHWIVRFWEAVSEYHRYTGEMSVMALLIGHWSRALELPALALTAVAFWRERRTAAKSEAFGFMAGLALATTALVVPSYGPYNQALLIPSLLFLLEERRMLWRRSMVNRILILVTIAAIGWTWVSAVALSALSFVLPSATVEKGWPVPFWTILYIPVVVAAVMLVSACQRTFAPSSNPSPS